MIVQFNDFYNTDDVAFHKIESEEVLAYPPVTVKDFFTGRDRLATRLELEDGSSLILHIWEPYQVKLELSCAGWNKKKKPVSFTKPTVDNIVSKPTLGQGRMIDI